MSALIKHAKLELEKAGLFDKDSYYNGMLKKSVLELIEVFDKQGHSGFSAELTIELFSKLAKFRPLTPLTSEDDEWVHIANEDGVPLYQNKRDYTPNSGRTKINKINEDCNGLHTEKD